MPPDAASATGPHASRTFSSPAHPRMRRRVDLNREWLRPLRWGALAGQAITVLYAAVVLGPPRPLLPVAVVLAASALANLAAIRHLSAGRPVSRLAVGSLLVLDTLLLTGLLVLCGGASNPFSALYLLDITLAAVLLGGVWTWSLTALSATCYAALIGWESPVEAVAGVGHVAHGAPSTGLVSLTHYEGMWIAFTVTASLTAALVLKLSQSVAAKGAEAVSMRERALRSERLATVTTLAAGAAHELGSPLGTIAVAASELTRKLDALPGSPPALAEDARLIRSEVGRCRAVLDRLASEGGEITGEGLVSVHLHDLLAEVVAALAPAEAARVVVRQVGEEELGRLLLPRRAVVQTLRDLVRNGIDASPPGAKVILAATEVPGRVVLTVEDRGTGMEPELLARVGEPFLSTKPPGRGIGLGLFLARGLCDRLGWVMEIDSQPGAGSQITIVIPRTEEQP